MIVSHDWVRGFVPHALSPEALGELLGRHVATLDGLQRLRADLAPFVVARVVESEKIPDTKLSFNKVDDGSGTLLEVVCGAPVVTVGAMYPFARSGTMMPAGFKIEKKKIRGFVSNGMLCSERELGLGEDSGGILELHTDAAPGTPLLTVMPIGDVQIELDVLANRPDLLSQHGVAREVSALLGVPLGLPDELRSLAALPKPVHGAHEGTSAGASVFVEDADGCSRYMAVVIRGVTIGASPSWLVDRLKSVGARSISNVVDATNYMLHGFGQPMHAFDLGKLAKSTIVVRRARAGEKITTLDGVTRPLSADMTVIADGERAMAVAGVMGGLDSEVTDTTTDILLEVATFDAKRVRQTRRELGLSTDASYRFERGIDGGATARTLELAAGLIVQVAGGRIDGAPIDVGGPPPPFSPVAIRPARVNRLLGAPFEAGEIARRLTSVGFQIVSQAGDSMQLRPPSWRHDVTQEVDLIEEVARLGGFDSLPDELRPWRLGHVPDHPVHLASQRVTAALIAAGLAEVKPMPFVNGVGDGPHARVDNPLGEDEPYLRTTILDTLARRAEYNLNRSQGNVRLFEIGSVFTPGTGPLPREEVRVGALVMGSRRPPHFTDPKPPAYDMWDAKQLAELIANNAFNSTDIELIVKSDDALWEVRVDSMPRGFVRRVALDAPVWAAPCYGIEITLDAMSSALVAPPGRNAWGAVPHREALLAARQITFKTLPLTPAAEFDVALIVPDTTAAAVVEAVMRKAGGELLESLVLFDEFRAAGIPDGARSLAWRLTFRHPERTLRDKEVEGRRAQLLKTLESELGVRPRSS